MLFRILFLVSLCLISPWLHADAADHPLLSRYPEADIRYWLYTEYERLELPAGPVNSDGSLPVETLIGDFTRITYEIKGVSTLKVFESYQKALSDAGAEMVSVCELERCGGKNSGLRDLADGVSGDSYVGNYYRKPYFIRAQLEGSAGKVHVGLFIGGFRGDVWLQQVVIEEVPAEDDLVSVSQDYLEREFDAVSAGDQRSQEEKEQDHPMIARYPGATLSRSRSVEYEKMTIPLSVVSSEGIASEELDLTGNIYQYTYEAKNISTLKVYQNYLQAVKALGFSLSYSCELNECGGEQSSREVAERLALNKNVQNYYRNPYYFVADRDTPQGRMVVAFYFGGYRGDVWIQQVIVEEKGTQTDLVKVDADQLYQDIQQTGKALVYGIYFDTDSATVKPESADALQAISDLLSAHPELNLYVVGHTDDTGEGDYNLSLSSRRASSVVDALQTDYSVDDDRLKSAGVGPYAPVAGNESDQGRRLNRRVELVRRL